MNLTFIKKHPAFTLCLGIAALLLLGAGTGLFLSGRLYARQASALDKVMARLQQLYQRKPFPATENVRKEAENLKDVVDRYNELNELLRAGQVNLQPMEAADFMQFLEKSLRQLRDRLQNANIKFPEKYAFGFDKYAGGLLPASGDIPRLVQQLKIIEALCGILQDAAIAELVSIERDNFEQAHGADVSAGRRGAPQAGGPALPETAGLEPGGDKLMARQPFKIVVKAKESAVIEMLNLLAGRPMFIVVTSVEMTNPLQDSGVGGPATASAPGKPGSAAEPGQSVRERQIVLGREELEAKLNLDVYQFAPSLEFKEGAKKP